MDIASAGESLAMIEDLCGTKNRLAMIRNDRNTGVAHVLNQGCKNALEKRYPWTVTFDQDTVVSEDYLESMLDSSSALMDAEVGVIGCNYYAPNLDRMVVRNASSLGWEERAVVTTSIALLALRAYKQVGDFRNDFFIDAVNEKH